MPKRRRRVPVNARREVLDGNSHVASDQSIEITTVPQRADEAPFLLVHPRRESSLLVSVSGSFAKQPGHEQEIPGSREQHGRSRKERVAQRIPNPTQSQFVATLLLRKHGDDLPSPTLVSLGIVKPR